MFTRNIHARRLMKMTLPIVLSIAVFGAGAGAASHSSLRANVKKTKANHTPILIGSEAPLTSPIFSLPENVAGMDAAIDSINASGGVHGHPLKLVTCDTGLTANGELSCAHQMLTDHVVAVLDATIVIDQSGAEFSLFAKAGIPFFAGPGTSPTELTSSNSFPLSSGGPGWFYGQIQALINAGATKFAIFVGQNLAVTQYSVSQDLAAFQAFGIDPSTVSVVYADPTSDPTLAAAAAKVTSGGVNGIAMVPTNPVLMVNALRASGYAGVLSGISSTTEAVLPFLGTAANGILVSSQTAFATDTSNPAVKSFIATMTKYQPKGKISGNSLSAYASVELFANVAKTSTVKTLTAASFKKAANSIRKPINIGLIGPWATAGRHPAISGDPRLLQPYIQYGVVVNGKFKAVGGGFQNPFKSS